jgi:ubiquinone/menaquinone biosynthesis C-methylase UbiE
MLHTEAARYYDKIYSWKDYEQETSWLVRCISDNLKGSCESLLDVACGSGRHLELLKRHYTVEGLDLSETLLSLARSRNPDIRLHHGDMMSFELGRTFDVVTCLFSSIGYAKSAAALRRTIATMARHVRGNGLLLVEPWFSPQNWHTGTVHAQLVNEPDLKIARIHTSMREDRLSVMDMHYLVGTPAGTDHFVERHELGLFTPDEMRESFTAANCSVSVFEDWPGGRGLYLGVKAA